MNTLYAETRVKNRIHGTLARHNVVVPGADLFGVEARRRLALRLRGPEYEAFRARIVGSSTILLHVVGVFLIPIGAAVRAQFAVTGIFSDFLPVVLRTPAPLAVRRTADYLLGMINGVSEFLSAIRADCLCHTP